MSKKISKGEMNDRKRLALDTNRQVVPPGWYVPKTSDPIKAKKLKPVKKM